MADRPLRGTNRSRPTSSRWRLSRIVEPVPTVRVDSKGLHGLFGSRRWIATLVFVALGLAALIFARSLAGPWIRSIDDSLGFRSPFAPRVRMPFVGAVPRWAVVVALCLCVWSFAFATGASALRAFGTIGLIGAVWSIGGAARFALLLAIVGWIMVRPRIRSSRPSTASGRNRPDAHAAAATTQAPPSNSTPTSTPGSNGINLRPGSGRPAGQGAATGTDRHARFGRPSRTSR